MRRGIQAQKDGTYRVKLPDEEREQVRAAVTDGAMIDRFN